MSSPAIFSLADLDGTNGVCFVGIDAGDESGRSVASAGEVNGDGIDDLLIGAFGADPGGREDAGETYLVFGSANLGQRPSIAVARRARC